jgi:hypothetical protein
VWTIDNVDPFSVLVLPTNLSDINALTPADSTIIVGDGVEWVAETGATARTSLGLGTGDSPAFTALTLSGLTTGHVVLANSAGALTALDVTAKGSLIVGDGAGAPVAVAVAANGTVLTADSSTDSGVAWSAATQPGLVFISSATISTDAAIDFTGISSTYDEYEFHLLNVIPTNDGQNIVVRTSTNGGSSYDSGASDYSTQYISSVSTTVASFGAATTTGITLGPGGIGSATNEMGLSCVLRLIRPSEATYTRIDYAGGDVDSSGVLRTFQGAGQRLSAADVDAVRFLASAGNLQSGIIKMYGVRKS